MSIPPFFHFWAYELLLKQLYCTVLIVKWSYDILLPCMSDYYINSISVLQMLQHSCYLGSKEFYFCNKVRIEWCFLYYISVWYNNVVVLNTCSLLSGTRFALSFVGVNSFLLPSILHSYLNIFSYSCKVNYGYYMFWKIVPVLQLWKSLIIKVICRFVAFI